MIVPGVGDAIQSALRESAKDAKRYGDRGETYYRTAKEYRERRFHQFMHRQRPDLDGKYTIEWVDDDLMVTPNKDVLDTEIMKYRFEQAASHLIASFGLIGKVKLEWHDDEPPLKYGEPPEREALTDKAFAEILDPEVKM